VIKRLTIAMTAAGIVSGCSMAPTYQRPEAPIAGNYPIKTEKAAIPATEIGWQDFFRDARLKALIATALENNRDLRIAALRIEEARSLYDVQSADRLPNLNVTAAGARAGTPADLSTTGIRTVSSRYDVGLRLASFELDFFGRVRSLNDAALASYLATEEAQRSAQISLIAEVAKAYLNERAYGEQLELARRSYEARKSSYQLSQKRFEVGATSALDLRQFETLMDSARVSMVTLARQRAQAENALVLLTGKPMGNLPSAQPLSDQGVLMDIPPGLPSDLLENRPDIRQYEQRLKAANANIGAARAAFFPSITLTAGRGTASSTLSGLFNAGQGAWSFAPQLTLPIFDAGRNMANLDLSETRKNIAIAEYEKTIQTAFREVADTLVARNLLNEQVDAQAAVLAASRERLKLSEARYENGISSSLDVLDAQRELFSAEQSLVQARLLRLTNSIDLYRSLGGGLKAQSQAAKPAPQHEAKS